MQVTKVNGQFRLLCMPFYRLQVAFLVPLGIYLVERWYKFPDKFKFNLLADGIISKLVGFPYILDGLLQVVAGHPVREGGIEEVERLELRHVLEAEHVGEKYLRYLVPNGTYFFSSMYDFSPLRVGQHDRIERSGKLRLEPIA